MGKQEGVPMDEAWEEFASSGRVTDYLRFVAVRKEREEQPDGREHHSDGDGFKCHADWGK